MHPILIAVLVYLVVGLVLTRNVLRVPRKRLRVRDMALGAAVMPVLFVIYLACILAQDLWARLLIILDFDPPEEMRAGPKPPAENEAGKQ